MRHLAPSPQHHHGRVYSLLLASDPLAEVGDSRAVRPNLERPTLRDIWEESLRKREQQKRERKQPENRRPESRQPQSEHRIDDYA